MEVKNAIVWGLEESIRASGFPMLGTGTQDRAETLGRCKPGTGHDCFLKGIIVQADITAPQYWWLQWQRYHFCDIVSSQSKMHRITKMNLEKQCNSLVSEEAIHNLRSIIINHKNGQVSLDEVLSNVPMGLELKARITTNYLQLKSQYIQRKKHRSEEWQEYCRWILMLPDFKELTGVSE